MASNTNSNSNASGNQEDGVRRAYTEFTGMEMPGWGTTATPGTGQQTSLSGVSPNVNPYGGGYGGYPGMGMMPGGGMIGQYPGMMGNPMMGQYPGMGMAGMAGGMMGAGMPMGNWWPV